MLSTIAVFDFPADEETPRKAAIFSIQSVIIYA
jgi:hypothetical protein